MRAGDLKYRIALYQLTIQTTDFGDTREIYEYKGSYRARVNYAGGSELIENDQIFHTVTREFIVRAYVPVVETDIIIWNDQKWRIISIDHNKQYNDIIIRTELMMGENLTIVNNGSI